jgi:hypothetical protein
MSLVKSLRMLFFPPKIVDPVFGKMRFMYISSNPTRSYWECEDWLFPPTNSRIGLSLDGGEDGPKEEFRQFYLNLVPRFESLVRIARPSIEKGYAQFVEKRLPEDLFEALRFTAFHIEKMDGKNTEWNMMFETRSDDYWYAFTIPFVGDTPGEAIVDS